MMKPAMIAGSASGSVTEKILLRELAPRIAAASSSSEGNASRATETNVNVYGMLYSAITKMAPARL